MTRWRRQAQVRALWRLPAPSERPTAVHPSRTVPAI